MNFRLKVPCGNCPFRKEGAIDLREGRLDGIIETLHESDYAVFHCHKTVHHPKGGDWKEDGTYVPSGNEAICMGAVAYMWRSGETAVATRYALLAGLLSIEDIEKVLPDVIECRSALHSHKRLKRKPLK